MIRLTDGCRSDPQNAFLIGDLREHRIPMNMSQLIIGTALGFFVAQGALYGIGRSLAGFSATRCGSGFASARLAGSDLIGAFIRHAGLIGASAALITLGVWSAKDYLASRSAHSAAIADTFDTRTGSRIGGPAGRRAPAGSTCRSIRG